MKRSGYIALFCLIIFLVPPPVSADYVLPYPSTMPGSKLYKVHVVWESLMKYWYFGDFGQFTYNLKESDKYLVEAKTLFEYQQYALGVQALQKSDMYFSQVPRYLTQAKLHGKSVSDDQEVLRTATIKHQEVLQKMLVDTPEAVTWSPEKAAASRLQLHAMIVHSMSLRNGL